MVRTALLKDDATTRIELIEAAAGRYVRKTYRIEAWLRWRTLGLPSKAAREFRNLRALEAAGIAVAHAVAFDEDRKLGMVKSCSITTAYVESKTAKQLITEGSGRSRPAILHGIGLLLRRVHDAGFVSTTAYPRNILVEARAGMILLCDQPAAIKRRESATGSAASLIDLFDLAFSPSRRRELSRTDSLRLLEAYCAHDKALERRLWRRLRCRRRWHNRLAKGWCVAADKLAMLFRRT